MSAEKKAVVTGRASTKHIRISPRKLRLVIDTVRYIPVNEAFYRLRMMKQKGAKLVEKTLKGAVASAKGFKLDEDRLFISEIKADVGPMFKRFMARSMGRADRLVKRTAHLTVVVSEGKKNVQPPVVEKADAEVKTKTKSKKLAKSK